MNTTRFFVALTLSLAVAAPMAAPAQDPARNVSSLGRLERTLDTDTYRAVVATIEAARSRALPTDPLVDRALEGAMKRVPGPRIRAAVSTLADRLEVARAMLAPAPTEADIAAGAGALGVGVPQDVLRTIRSIQPDRPVAVPLGVLTELVARNVPVERAATLVVQLIRRGATPTQLVALSGDVQRDIAAGLDPGAALDLRTRGVASALPGGATASEDFGSAPNAPSSPATGMNSGRGNPPNTSPSPRPGARRP